jgi:hypothetical protein
MTDKEAFNEFAKRIALTLVVMGVLLLFAAIFSTPDETPKENFAVVDTYKGCDVVRWDNSFAEYKYFLDCKK